MTVLERLRAYAAAHPSDVAVIAEGARQDAEIEAYRALAELTRKWRRRNSGTRLTRALARAAVNAALDKEMGGSGDPRRPWSQTQTVVGMPRTVLDEEPFPLTRLKRLPPPPRAPKRLQTRPGFCAMVAHFRREYWDGLRRDRERVRNQGRPG